MYVLFEEVVFVTVLKAASPKDASRMVAALLGTSLMVASLLNGSTLYQK